MTVQARYDAPTIPADASVRAPRLRGITAGIVTVVGVLLGGFVAAPTALAATIAQHYTTADHVLSLMNQERADNGLPALHVSARLTESALDHNIAMADADTMSHQCSGEASLGDRVDAVHYDWSTLGENIGWTSAETMPATLDLQTYMYDEKAPDDGHRLNILSTSYDNVGISVITDSTHHKLWITEDFGHLM